MRNAGHRVAFGLTALGAALTAVGVAVCLLLNPVWVGFEQDRSDVTGLTGYSSQQVRDVTGSILADLVFGPPAFDVAVDGVPVLSERERSHMADVRDTFARAGLVVVAGAVLLVALGAAARGGRRFWLAVRAGAVLAIGVVVVAGSLSVVFFDQAFELMHRIFFKSGTYTFDPRTDRLVQLFPDEFWFESAVALGVAIVAIAALMWIVANRLVGAGPEPGEGVLP